MGLRPESHGVETHASAMHSMPSMYSMYSWYTVVLWCPGGRQTMPRSKQRSKMRRQTRQTRQTLQTLQTVSEGPGCPTRTHSCRGSILTCVQQTEMDGILMGYDGRLYPDAFLRPFWSLFSYVACLFFNVLHSRIWCQCISHSSEECLCSADCPPPHPWASSAFPLCKSRCDQLETSYYFITRCSLLSAVETIHIKVFHPAWSWVCPKLRPSMIILVKMLAAQSVLIRAHLDDCVIVSFAMPGDLALKSTAIETFFYGMKPRYPAGRGYDLYQNQTLVGKL